MIFPDYHGGSIANLMSSIALAMGGWETGYLPLGQLDADRLGRVRNLVLLVVDGLAIAISRSAHRRAHCSALC